MCLIFLAYNKHPKYPLVIAANRDEFLDRPAKQLGFWEEHPSILAGKDLTAGGTWLGVTKTGYFAMLTNYRDLSNIKANAPSRGKLVLDYLTGELEPSNYLQALNGSAGLYNGYNIILGTVNDPWYYSNQNNKIYQLGTGIYGLSNALLDTKWPKVERGKKKFAQLIKQETIDIESLMSFMNDKNLAEDEQLPDTGIGYEKEKLLSSMFIDMPGYGTRNTTILLKDNEGNIHVTERSFNIQNNALNDQSFKFSLNN
jgi:uncharacterized protein with NRDE domain